MLCDATYSGCNVQPWDKDDHANQGDKSLYTGWIGFDRENGDDDNDGIQKAKTNHTPSSRNSVYWFGYNIPSCPHWRRDPWEWDIFEQHVQAKECIDQAKD